MRTTLAWIVCFGSIISVASAEGPLRLKTERLDAVLDPASKAGLTSLSVDGRECLASPSAGRLFQLDFVDAQQKRTSVTSRDARQCRAVRDRDHASAVTLVYSDFPGRSIEVTCTLNGSKGPWLRGRLSAKFPSELVLENVTFPLVTLKAPLEGQSANVVLGSTKGGVYRRVQDQKPGQGVSANQPGNLTAGMACYYGDSFGLVTAAFDVRGYRKSVFATRTTDGLDFGWRQPCFAQGQFKMDFDLALAGFGPASGQADWRDAADLYKAWALKQPWCAKTLANRRDLPDWLRQGPAMVRFSRDWLAKPERVESWLNDYWRKQFPRTPLVVAYWGWEKVATWVTPEYFPCYPSDEVFRRLVEAGKKVDGHTFLWPSGYHYTVTYGKRGDGSFEWDDRARFDAEIRQHCVVGRDGIVPVAERSWLRGGTTATVCPGDPWTIDWFNRISTEIVQRGADMVQVDQVVGGGFPVCYSTKHGHPPGAGCWSTDVFRRQLETMLAACRKVIPDSVVCFEEPNEWFIQQVGFQDYRDLETKGELASVFNYLYHEYLPTFQSNPHPANRFGTAWCMATGQVPHLVPSMQLGPGPLLSNGGFEEIKNDLPEGWEKVNGYQGKVYDGAGASDRSQHRGGAASLRLYNTRPGQIVQVSRNLTVGGKFLIGHTYRLRVWMKSGGLKQSSVVALAALGSGLKSKGSWHIAMPREAGDWTEGTAQFTMPEHAEMLRIMLQVTGPGEIWLDDIRLEEVLADGSVVEVGRPDKPIDHDFMRRWVELFCGEGRPYLLLGKMVHPPRLECGTTEAMGRTYPAVLHNAFEAPDGSVAAVLVNATDRPQKAACAWPGQPSKTFDLEPWQAVLARK